MPRKTLQTFSIVAAAAAVFSLAASPVLAGPHPISQLDEMFSASGRDLARLREKELPPLETEIVQQQTYVDMLEAACEQHGFRSYCQAYANELVVLEGLESRRDAVLSQIADAEAEMDWIVVQYQQWLVSHSQQLNDTGRQIGTLDLEISNIEVQVEILRRACAKENTRVACAAHDAAVAELDARNAERDAAQELFDAIQESVDHLNQQIASWQVVEPTEADPSDR